MRGDSRAGLFSLGRRLQQKLPHPAGSQTLHEVEKGAVLESPLAPAILFPARQVLLYERSAQEFGGRVDASGKFRLPLVQGARGNFLQRNSLNHISY